ncbi:MAG: biopolymer transporter ExbD [Pirellulales bacterium]|nr:biopolymer transporter ExbD [Pirellulales bacterium]
MRLPLHHRNGRTLEVRMTPMIDVIFLLLIFFVCTASFQAVEEILPTNLQLPGAVETAAPPDPDMLDLDEIVVRILWQDDQPRWRINERDYEKLADVRNVLVSIARLKNDLPVILDVDGNVPLEKVIDVYDACRQIGLRRIQFAASEKV